jgi:hypothetical protein
MKQTKWWKIELSSETSLNMPYSPRQDIPGFFDLWLLLILEIKSIRFYLRITKINVCLTLQTNIKSLPLFSVKFHRNSWCIFLVIKPSVKPYCRFRFLVYHESCTVGWPYTEGTWLYCYYFMWCVSCTLVVLTCFVMCGCNVCTCIYCVLYCLYRVCVLFHLFIFILYILSVLV